MVKQKEWTTEDIKLLKEFLANDKSVPFIAQHFGIKPTALRMFMSRRGIRVHDSKSGKPGDFIRNRNKEIDLATRIRVLKGEELRQDAPRAFFTDEQIQTWISGVEGFSKFCKEVLSVEMQPYQLEMCEKMLNSRRCCFVMGRQSGKDFTISCFVIWLSVCNSNRKVLLVSAAQRQSDLLFNRILSFIAQSNELFDSVEKSNLEMMKFKNNSEVYNLPSTSFIRGFTEVSHIFVNEAAHGVSDDTVYSVLTPMLATTNGCLVLMSSPSGMAGAFWESFNNALFANLQLPSSVNKYVSKEWLESVRQEMPAIQYMTEVEAQFSQSLDVFFPASLIAKCSQTYDFYSFAFPERSYFLGVDVGRVKDFSVLTVVEVDRDKVKRVVGIVTLESKPFVVQKEFIKKLHGQFLFSRICVEKAGLSLQLVEDLRSEGLPVLEFVPTADSKAEAYNFLLKEMEEGRVIIPKGHSLLQFELRTFTYEISKSGKMLLHHASEDSHDDHVDSLCFSVWASKRAGESVCWEVVGVGGRR